ncbi:hypothetical protein BB31_00400 [Amycolatopsis lurida NRRL 2430]|uniref:SD-repeat containing protein B domain-containing protein n=1 Tax=Amycolatopsis lurida NRRL 2430 TaxID=1460371 RepID=A0A2P2G1Z0_AMYLU|nr:hypothetical protein BB31_00400 [Amycolatopsis lurida NRRL 2430]
MTGVFAAPALADPEPSAPTSSAPATSETPSSTPAPTPSAPPVENSSPAAPKPEAERARVEASVTFEKPSYKVGEDVRFTFKIKNVGGTRAVGLQVNQFFSEPGSLSIPYEPGWGAWGRAPGVSLEPDETKEVTVTGQIGDLDKDIAVVRGFVSDETGLNAGEFNGTVPVTKVTGRVAGVVFGDKNGNGKLDDGEQLADIPLTLRYSIGSKEYKATSDADGKIDFGDVPAVEYLLSGGGDSIKGWLFPLKVIRAGADTTDLPIRGVRPLNDALKASVSFTKDTYKPGELAHVTVKLTNYGRLPLVGIVAGCNRAGVDFALKGGPGWGELEYFAGATIAPGQTRIFDVTEKIPDGALNHGRVSVSCDFGYTDVGIGGNPHASDEAAVPGGIATLAGQVIHTADPDKPAKGLAGVKVVLASDGDCPTIVETATDAEGHFKIANLVPGPKYRLFFAPPQGWRILYDNPISIYVVGPVDNPARLYVEAGQGDEPPPTLPTRRPGCDASATTTPAPGAPGNQASGGGTGLARTGADVLGLGALALATLVLGAGLVFTSRRRRHQAD